MLLRTVILWRSRIITVAVCHTQVTGWHTHVTGWHTQDRELQSLIARLVARAVGLVADDLSLMGLKMVMVKPREHWETATVKFGKYLFPTKLM